MPYTPKKLSRRYRLNFRETKRGASARGQSPVLVIADRLFDLFARVHDERTVLDDGLEEWAPGEQDDPSTVRAARERNGVAIVEHAGAVRRKPLRRALSTDVDAAFERIDERVIARRDRMGEHGVRRELDVE